VTGRVASCLPDLLAPLANGSSIDRALGLTVRRLIAASGGLAGGIVFRPARGRPIVVTAGRARMARELDAWLRAGPDRSRRSAEAKRDLAGARSRRARLGDARRPLGELILVGGRARSDISRQFARELGTAIERAWELDRRMTRMRVLDRVTRLAVSDEPIAAVLEAFAAGVGELVAFDAMTVPLIDAERAEFTLLDPAGRATGLGGRHETRVPLDATLLERAASARASLRVDDLSRADVPARSRELLAGLGFRSVMIVPLVSRGAVAGAVTLAARSVAAFTADDAQVVEELSQPLAAAIEQRRLLDEARRRGEELAALFATSRLIATRLELASLLESISRAVTELIGGTGCAIGLLSDDGKRIDHVAAQGAASAAWRGLSLPIGEGIIGRCAAQAVAIRVDDVRADERSVRRDVDELEGLRSMLCVPLAVGGRPIGVISAFSTELAAFTAHHQQVLDAFAEQAGIAIQNARLFEQSQRRGRETRALLEAGRAVTASLDVNQTIRVIMEAARSVLGVESCSISTLDAGARELVTVASLDLPQEMVSRIRLRVGEGIAGLAVSERRPMQSAQMEDDPRVRYRQLSQSSGFQSMLAAPLRIGENVIGAISVLRRDVHRFSPDEEQLLLALADQAAIALEHARLYTQLEGMVAERTRELDEQRRFVEVVLEALPLGVFVVDRSLAVVRVNREGARLLGAGATRGTRFPALVSPDRGARISEFLHAAFSAPRLSIVEEETVVAGETRLFRFTAAAIEPHRALGAREEGERETGSAHLVVLVEDVTLAKRLERQMLLTERLTTAGRLAAGVAHELNNPLATIAGCAEALRGRLGEGQLAGDPGADDFRHYLGLIEEEAYRCKEITGSLLGFVREPGSRRAPADVNGLVTKTVELLSHQSRVTAERFQTDLAPDLPPITVNEGQLRQVFLGLAANALDAMGPSGLLRIRTRLGRGEVEIDFEDEGPGIPDEVLSRIFDPFFTTKPPGQGTGLGLAIAQSIVTDHGGRIEVTSHVGTGSIFRVVLPL
jgi:signal transduction histidine kinase/putative methionine-R-sulfoxide reductase with GAF domain